MTIKLLSGMFKSMPCFVFVSGKGVRILPNDPSEKEMMFAFGRIKDISTSQSGDMQARFEITTVDGMVSGIFEKQADVGEFVKRVRAKAGKSLHTELRFQ